MGGLADALPTGLGWGLIVALLVRGIAAAIPRIVAAMTERTIARRLEAQAQLARAETERAGADERRDLTHRLEQVEKRLRDQEAACGHEIESAHAMHRVTRERLDSLMAQHEQCARRLDAMRVELDTLRRQLRAGHSP